MLTVEQVGIDPGTGTIVARMKGDAAIYEDISAQMIKEQVSCRAAVTRLDPRVRKCHSISGIVAYLSAMIGGRSRRG